MPPETASNHLLAIDVSDTQSHLLGLDSRWLAAIVRRVLASERIERAEVSIAIVDDRTIHEINRRHLDHDCPTDVISFVLSDPDDTSLAGELIVSAETAVRSAHFDGIEATTELALYVIHGLLHLCGHDDLTESGAAAMRRLEADRLTAEGLSHPFSTAGLASTGEGSSWAD